jgi:hypothetical protein
MTELIIFNQEKYPIVSISTKCELFDEKMTNDYLITMLNFYKQNEGKNIIIIYELSLLKAVDAKGRIKIGEWLKTNSEIIKKAVAGVCYVQNNVFHKIILQGIFAIKTPEWKHKVVKNLEEGIIWGNEILKQ